jgi:hypoxanthine phosphoribosyltransferase
MEKIMTDWKMNIISTIKFHMDVHNLSKQIPINTFDYIYGIPRGGLVIAVYLSHRCNIPLINSLNKDIKNVLIVDDIADTGKTLAELKEYNFQTATLYYKSRSIIKPTFIGEEVENDEWVVFPWELYSEKPNRTIEISNKGT